MLILVMINYLSKSILVYNLPMSKTHDSSYKFLFSNPELVRDLIMGFIPDDWLHGLDYSTLEKVPGSYVSDDFQQREDDIVWKVKVSVKIGFTCIC